MGGRKWILVVVTASAVVLAYWLGTRNASEHSDMTNASQSKHADQDRGDMAPAEAEQAARRIRAVTSSTSMPPATVDAVPTDELPAADMPVLALIDELDARARRGDAKAACRLGVELLRCRKERQQGQIQALLQSAVDQRMDEAADFEVDLLARMQERADVSAKRCAGVGPEHWRRAVEYQRLAAERGNARMRLWYVAEPALDPAFFLEDLEEWARYRAVAWDYLGEAMAAGLPAAPMVMARVHLPEDAVHTYGMALRRPNAFMYFVHAELDRLLNPKPERVGALPPGSFDPTPQPGPEIDMARVRLEAERLRHLLFASHVPDPAIDESSAFSPAGSDPDAVCGNDRRG